MPAGIKCALCPFGYTLRSSPQTPHSAFMWTQSISFIHHICSLITPHLPFTSSLFYQPPHSHHLIPSCLSISFILLHLSFPLHFPFISPSFPPSFPPFISPHFPLFPSSLHPLPGWSAVCLPPTRSAHCPRVRRCCTSADISSSASSPRTSSRGTRAGRRARRLESRFWWSRNCFRLMGMTGGDTRFLHSDGRKEKWEKEKKKEKNQWMSVRVSVWRKDVMIKERKEKKRKMEV